ncbi:type II secretion system F family protein [Fodinicurvata fenggangensis]|uniref:type II secretion system F family protein n=1 Tax=Fodinicurvata fenggangensis TaxID=1121830 RepID=UPI00068C1021|nr:type II secretion system F family protein [Fodinicurvata fenggangensis]
MTAPILIAAIGALGTLGFMILLTFLWHLLSAPERRRRQRRLAMIVRTAGTTTGGKKASQEREGIRREERTGVSARMETALFNFVPRLSQITGLLRKAGLDISATGYLCMMGGLTLLALFLLSRMLPLPFILQATLSVIFGIGLPHFTVVYLGARRQKKILAQLPDVLDMIVRSVRAGLPLTQSLMAVGDQIDEPLGSELSNIGRQTKLGVPLDEALLSVAERLDIQEFYFLVTSLTLQQKTGGSLADTLGNLSDLLRQRHQVRNKIKALSSEARASAYLIGSLPIALLGGMSVLNPGYLQPLFETDTGNILLWIGGGGIVTGAIVMWRMMRFDI